MNALPWVALFLPLVAAVAITLGTRRQRGLSALLSIGAVGAAFGCTAVFILNSGLEPGSRELLVSWIEVGDFQVDFGLRLDPLSLLMLLVVTGVASVIHLYSWGYMHGDPGLPRYFASLSFFTFSMLGIVLANNFVQLFIFWELVGVSSYLLIGFWFERPAAADASKKAFLTNRVGDFGFLIGILMVWGLLGSLNFSVLEDEIARNPAALGGAATVAGLLIFCGAVGKSAQFPLHVWLPDAMEGPTPVSALIHAATMVAAGVYMLCRVFFLLDLGALEAIGWVGGLTALLAALMAVQQDDIKRILAYSTLSQLGYMVMAVGAQGPTAAMYHLTTHAFFKALLFLGAGSVIYRLHHEQNIWAMGGLRRRMPLTWWTFLIGTLALCGVPPFSGFFSKDAVLSQALSHHPMFFVLGVIVAVLTNFYMFRLIFVAFLGTPRSEPAGQAHESPLVMTFPLVLLALGSLFGGYWGIDALYARQFHAHVPELTGGFLTPVLQMFGHSPLAGLFGLLAILVGFGLAAALYANAAEDPLPGMMGVLARAMRNRFYLDEIYERVIACTHEALAEIANGLDRWVISGLLVRGTHGTTEFIGRALRLLQTGNAQTYAFFFAAGAALLLFLALRP